MRFSVVGVAGFEPSLPYQKGFFLQMNTVFELKKWNFKPGKIPLEAAGLFWKNLSSHWSYFNFW
jgi:hypothetical protein